MIKQKPFLCLQEFVGLLNLKPGQKVLDVGCGIGGGDFYMAKVGGPKLVVITYTDDAGKNLLDTADNFSDLWSGSAGLGSVREHGGHRHGEGNQ